MRYCCGFCKNRIKYQCNTVVKLVLRILKKLCIHYDIKGGLTNKLFKIIHR